MATFHKQLSCEISLKKHLLSSKTQEEEIVKEQLILIKKNFNILFPRIEQAQKKLKVMIVSPKTNESNCLYINLLNVKTNFV